MWNDLRYAVRSLRRTPAFSTAAMATLALGIGATTAIFTLVNAALITPVPYPEPNRLFVLTRGPGGSSQSGQVFLYVRERVRMFEAIAAQSGSASVNLVTPEAAVHAVGLRVSTDYFRVHGVRPIAGREFSVSEDLPNGPDAVVLSEALWQQLFDRRPDAIGKTVRLGGIPHTVVGIMPPDFRPIPAADLLVPLRTTVRDTGVNYRVFGRLAADASAAGVQAELTTLRGEAIRHLPGLDERNVAFEWVAYRDVLGRGMRQPLFVLLGAVGFLLLIACANVASLNVARAITRQRELATYVALGAGHTRVLRTLLVESLLIALASGAAGLALAAAISRLLSSLVSQDSARTLLSGATLDMDWRVLLAASAITLGTALFFGVAPAAVLSRLDLHQALAAGTRSTGERHTARLRRTLAVAEVALAVILLVGAGLLVRTFLNLTSVDLGFEARGVQVGRMSLQGTAAEDSVRREALFTQALLRLRQLPGVTAAAASNHVPVEPGLNLTLLPPAGGLFDRPRAVDWRYITPDYFNMFGIATRAGRTFSDDDGRNGRPVAVVNEAFARTYFARLDIIGQTIQLTPALQDPPREIVGVVADVKARSNSGFTRGLNALAAASAPAIFVPLAQAPDAAVRIAHRFFEMKWLVRTDGRAIAAVEPGMREALRAVDPTLPWVGFEPMTAVIAQDLDLQRLLMALMTAFATAATFLAVVGLSGLIAYSAAQRRREVGVRMALGATAASIAAAFIGEGLSIAVTGLTIGAVGALLVTRVLTSLLHGVTPFDAVTFVSAGALLVGVAAVAALIPSAAAARTDPVQALKAE